MRQLLHLSDVHFGPPHLPAVAAGVHRLIECRGPDLVVISGDLTQRAKPRQFREARAWVDEIECLGVPTLTVPGNHDVPLYRVWERVFAPLGAYRRCFSPQLEPIHEDGELLVAGVNTAHGWTLKGGRVSDRRLMEVEKVLRAGSGPQARIVVLHHPLVPAPGFGRQAVLRNAGSVAETLSRAGVEMVLSGHLHQASVASSEAYSTRGEPPFLIVQSGTSTSSRGRGAERGRQTCNWIRFDDEEWTIVRLGWDGDLGRFAEWSHHRYPRRGRRPYELSGRSPEMRERSRAGQEGEA